MAAERALRVFAVSVDLALIEPDEEAVWIARAKSGDEAGYRWLLDRYRHRAVRLATHVLRRPGEAEDVAQEAFIRAFRSLNSYRYNGRFYTWLYHIIVNICVDRQRLARWSREAPLDDATPVGTCGGPTDTRMVVEALLDQLSPIVRAALVLHDIEGLEYREIAQVLNVPVGTVRSRLNRARSQFREMWNAVSKETDDV